MKSFQSTAISCSFISWYTGTIAPESIMVWVPTSNTCTMWGAWRCR